jgi:transcriptional regulator with XRE-family HTH domain
MDQNSRKLWHVGDTAGTPRTRALASALRGAIAGSRLSVREAARLLDRSHTTISQWQTGKRVPTPDDVSALLAVLRVTGQRREHILELAHHASEPTGSPLEYRNSLTASWNANARPSKLSTGVR